MRSNRRRLRPHRLLRRHRSNPSPADHKTTDTIVSEDAPAPRRNAAISLGSRLSIPTPSKVGVPQLNGSTHQPKTLPAPQAHGAVEETETPQAAISQDNSVRTNPLPATKYPANAETTEPETAEPETAEPETPGRQSSQPQVGRSFLSPGTASANISSQPMPVPTPRDAALSLRAPNPPATPRTQPPPEAPRKLSIPRGLMPILKSQRAEKIPRRATRIQRRLFRR